MNPQSPTPPSEEPARVAPPTFSAPALLSPDTTIAPSAEGAQSVHGEITAPHVFQSTPAEVVSYNKLNPAGTNPLPVSAPTPAAPVLASEATEPVNPLPAAPNANQSAVSRRRRPFMSKKVLAVAVAAVVIIGIIAVVAMRSVGTQTTMAVQFISDIQAGNAANAYGLTSTKFQEATSKDIFESYTIKESQLLPKTKPAIVSTQTDKSSASSVSTVVMNIKNNDSGSDYHAVIQMVKEGSDWVVFSADIQSGLYAEPLSTSK